jgi:2-methylisocitrate lyase-like PEP mutase family enzyme
MSSIAEKRERFRKLHESGTFVIPNPWDVGSARFLQHLGFSALATTSAGFAFSQARPDGGVPREMMLEHIRTIVDTTDLPVNADFEGGFAVEPEGVAESVALCVATGVAGLSIEDSTGNREEPLYEIGLAVERVRAARKAIDAAGGGVLLTGRAECFFAGRPDLDDAIERLKAYSEAGADCLYAPGIRTPEQISAVVAAVAPKPVNVLVGSAGPLSVKDLAELGVRRISVGGGLAQVAWAAFVQAATQLAEAGSFEGFLSARPPANLNEIFREDLQRREV